MVKVGTKYAEGLCPFHAEKSRSFTVNDAQGFYHCFGCGAHGDAIRFIRETEGVGFVEAIQILSGIDLPVVTDAERVRAAAQDEADREAAIDEARTVWRKALPAAGTPAEAYARSRGITAPLPPSIRFARTPAWRDRETGEVGPDLPALVGAVIGAGGRLVGIQRIFLRDGGRAKASMRRPKLSLGRVKGGALRLGPAAEEILICEGPEDGLTLAQEMPGRSVWVALGTAMMPEMHLPAQVRRVVLAGDNDKAGRAAIERAGKAMEDAGLSVRLIFPQAGFKDFNDQLRGIRS